MKYILYIFSKKIFFSWVFILICLKSLYFLVKAQTLPEINAFQKKFALVSKKMDSMIEVLDKTDSFEEYKKILLRFDSTFRQNFNTQDSIARKIYVKKLLKFAENKNQSNYFAITYIYAGIFYKSFNKEEGLEFFKKAQILAEQLLDKGLLISVLKNTGILYIEQFLDLRHGTVFLLEALNLAKKNNITAEVINIHTNLILTHYRLKSYVRAKEYVINLLKNHEKALNHRQKISHINTLGLCEAKLKNEKSAEQHYLSAIDLAKLHKDTVWIGLASGNLASLYIKQHKFEPAIRLLRTDILYSEKYKEWESLFLSHLTMALCYLKMKDVVKAEVFYQKAQNIYRGYVLKNENLRENFYDTSLEFYLFKGDIKKALDFFYLSRDTRDSLRAIRQTEEIIKVQSSYDVIQKQDIITRLQKEKDEQDKNVRTQFYLITGLVMMIVFGSSGTFILYFIYLKNRRLNKKLQHQNEKITHQNAQIIAQAEELEKNNNTKDKLFSVISHDFRSPLANLSSVFRLLQDKSITQEQFGKFVPDFQRRLDVTLGFVDNLLYWAKSQMYGVEANPQFVHIKNIIRETLELIQSQTEKKKIEIIDETQNHLQIYADANMVRLIFRNLLTNAIKFSFENSKIWIMGWDMGDMVKIGIKDEGVGMTAQQVENLFKDDTLHTTLGTQNEKGTGLGLMLCYEFVGVNGGKMEVESQQGEGATFYFSLPKK